MLPLVVMLLRFDCLRLYCCCTLCAFLLSSAALSASRCWSFFSCCLLAMAACSADFNSRCSSCCFLDVSLAAFTWTLVEDSRRPTVSCCCCLPKRLAALKLACKSTIRSLPTTRSNNSCEAIVCCPLGKHIRNSPSWRSSLDLDPKPTTTPIRLLPTSIVSPEHTISPVRWSRTLKGNPKKIWRTPSSEQ